MEVSAKVIQYQDYLYIGFIANGRVYSANIMWFDGYPGGKRPLVSYDDSRGRKRHIWDTGMAAFAKITARNYKRALAAACK